MYELPQLQKGCFGQSDSMIISASVCELLARLHYNGKPSACCFTVTLGNVLLGKIRIVWKSNSYFQWTKYTTWCHRRNMKYSYLCFCQGKNEPAHMGNISNKRIELNKSNVGNA